MANLNVLLTHTNSQKRGAKTGSTFERMGLDSAKTFRKTPALPRALGPLNMHRALSVILALGGCALGSADDVDARWWGVQQNRFLAPGDEAKMAQDP